MSVVQLVSKDKVCLAIAQKIEDHKEMLLDPLLDHAKLKARPYVLTVVGLLLSLIILNSILIFYVRRLLKKMSVV